MSKFFINRPIVAMVISIVTGDRRRGHDRRPARCPISQHRASGNPGPGHLRRRGCADTRTGGCHAHRAADERRGQHELHVLA